MIDQLGKIGLSEEQADLFDVAVNFCAEKSPISKVRELMETDLGYDPDIWTEIAALGWLGIAIPEDFGGSGLGLAEVAPVVEAMGRALMTTPFVSTVLGAQVLLRAGNEAQKQQWLPKLATGTIATVALNEAGASWDLTNVACSAAISNGKVALSGTKRLVADAAAADLIIATVNANGMPNLITIDKSALPPGALRRETIVDETRRAFEITLDGIELPVSALLDSEHAVAALNHLHLTANLLSAAEMSGGNKSVIDYTLDYLKTRKQFGRLIGSYQALKHPIVDAYAQYEQGRSHLYAAAHCFAQQGTGEIATRMAKVSTLNAFAFASDRAIQFHGGFGFTYDCDAQLHRRRAIWHASQFGDQIYHKRKLAELILD